MLSRTLHHVSTYIHTSIQTCINPYIHLCMHTCMHAYIHTHIETLCCVRTLRVFSLSLAHTHTHTHTRAHIMKRTRLCCHANVCVSFILQLYVRGVQRWELDQKCVDGLMALPENLAIEALQVNTFRHVFTV